MAGVESFLAPFIGKVLGVVLASVFYLSLFGLILGIISSMVKTLVAPISFLADTLQKVEKAAAKKRKVTTSSEILDQHNLSRKPYSPTKRPPPEYRLL